MDKLTFLEIVYFDWTRFLKLTLPWHFCKLFWLTIGTGFEFPESTEKVLALVNIDEEKKSYHPEDPWEGRGCCQLQQSLLKMIIFRVEFAVHQQQQFLLHLLTRTCAFQFYSTRTYSSSTVLVHIPVFFIFKRTKWYEGDSKTCLHRTKIPKRSKLYNFTL